MERAHTMILDHVYLGLHERLYLVKSYCTFDSNILSPAPMSRGLGHASVSSFRRQKVELGQPLSRPYRSNQIEVQ
jgi:hypothetical protein